MKMKARKETSEGESVREYFRITLMLGFLKEAAARCDSPRASRWGDGARDRPPSVVSIGKGEHSPWRHRTGTMGEAAG